MNTFTLILVSTALISAVSFSGVLLILMRQGLLKRISIFLVALAAGAVFGASFLHLLPEAVEELEGELPESLLLLIIGGFLLFFVLEKTLHWHHAHRATHPHYHLGVLSLVGDFVHNFVDGLIIAAAFLVNPALGVSIAVATALHEIPQEISEFGVLMYAGFTKTRALLFNFLSATSVIVGGLAGFALGGALEAWIPALMFFAIGSFLYLGASDFVPEIRKEEGFWKSLTVFVIFVAGIAVMWLFTFLEG